MTVRDRCVSAAKALKKHNRFTDSPGDRVVDLSKSLFLDPTLPNILLGTAITATIQRAVGVVPLRFVVLSWVAFVAAVGVYAVGNEIVHALQTVAEEAQKPDVDDDAGYQ